MGVDKVAVVTGGNKGIGYAIVKGLCEKFNGKVYLTARDENRGTEAVNTLKELGFNPVFYKLDLNDEQTIQDFKEHVKKTDGGIDLLVNNAAIAFKHNATEPVGEQAEVTVGVNYFGTLKVCDSLFPLLREKARVVNVSSSAGHLSRISSAELREKFSNPNLTVDQLNDLMKQFISDAKESKQVEKGWGHTTYGISKVGISALTIIQQRNFDAEAVKRNISVNSVHPGYVDTDMSSHKGPLSTAEGAQAPLFLALQDHGLRGKYVWCDSKVVDWFGPTTPAIV